MRLLPGRLPPVVGDDRFHFPVAPGVTLYAPSKDELIRRIFDFRLRNNVPIGDVEKDVDAYYCKTWPRFCTGENPTIPRISSESMLNRVSRWASLMIHKMPKGGYPLVTSVEAETRAAVCVNCRFNVGWKGSCGGCSSSTLQLVQQVKSLRRTKRDGNLAACAVTSQENSSSVWIQEDMLPITDQQRTQLPEVCWRRRAA